MKGKVLTFVLGLVLGVVAALLWPRFVTPRLPEGLRASGEAVEGDVVRKQREGDRLLLTVDTPEGAALATFTEKVAEIDLLVEEGDTVALALGGYKPFVDNPPIQGVRKAERPPAAAEEAAADPTPEPADEAPAPPADPGLEPSDEGVELEQWPGADEPG